MAKKTISEKTSDKSVLKKQVESIILEMKKHFKPENIAGMERYGIIAKKAFGLSAPFIQAMAKQIGKNHDLALELWKTEIYDCRTLALFLSDPKLLTKAQMDSWCADFDNWAICDGACLHLFRKSVYAKDMAMKWHKDKREFVKRAGFVMMATSAVHNKKTSNETFIEILEILERNADDDRNGVRKAVNWALRQIGKRSLLLNKAAIATAERIKLQNTKSARWIASDALRELKHEKIVARLMDKELKPKLK